MNKVDVSIIIVNYKTKKLTLQCIKSIYKSKPQVEFEVIVVDNSSEIKESKDYILISNNDNLGFAKANNQGIKRAKGKYILLLNSDTEIKNGAIDKLHEFALSNKGIGAVGPKLLNPDSSIQPSAFHFPAVMQTFKAYWLGQKHLVEKYAPKESHPVEVDVLVMAAFMITPQAISKVGMLDEKYFMYFEDFDYCRELHKAGLKVYYLPSAEVVHYHGYSGKRLAKKEDQWRRLIPSSKIYHGVMSHYLIYFIVWSRRQLNRVLWLLKFSR